MTDPEATGEDVGTRAFLEHAGEDGQTIRVLLERLPFRIGRSSEADFVIHSTKVSKEHAEISRRRTAFVLRDLGSRNGTFVNGERLGDEPRRLKHGDVLHVAHKEFRFGCAEIASSSSEDATAMLTSMGQEWALSQTRDLLRVLSEDLATAAFQPIVRLGDRGVVGYETLGRTSIPDLSYGIWELFRVADQHGRAVELSRMMRERAVIDSRLLPDPDVRLFMNLHPREMIDPGLLDHLADVRPRLPSHVTPVIEIHEGAVTDLGAMALLRQELRTRGFLCAYDDFGAGQSRLMELCEVPPDFIKLDMALVRGIDRSSPRQELVRALVHVMVDLGVRVLAEGIETEGELDTCRQLGCELGQGYLIRRPASVTELRLAPRPSIF